MSDYVSVALMIFCYILSITDGSSSDCGGEKQKLFILLSFVNLICQEEAGVPLLLLSDIVAFP